MTPNMASSDHVTSMWMHLADWWSLIRDAHRILMIDPNAGDQGSLVGVIGSGSPGLGPNLFDDPEGVAIHGTSYYFSDSDNNRIVRYSVVIN